MTPPGHLVLVPLPLDFGCEVQVPLDQVMPLATLQWAARLPAWLCENARTLRAFLRRVDAHCPLSLPIQQIEIQELPRELHKRGDSGRFRVDPDQWLRHALQGTDMGLASEAGMPAVADPGGSIVRAAHARGIPVLPLVGPAALALALAASGLNGQSFAFVGYLPSDAQERARRACALEATARKSGQTQLFIETPYRNAALMQTLLQVLQPATRLSVSANITLPDARTRTATIAQWRNDAWRPGKDQPAVFAIGI